jgi:hypothetical protein
LGCGLTFAAPEAGSITCGLLPLKSKSALSIWLFSASSSAVGAPRARAERILLASTFCVVLSVRASWAGSNFVNAVA